METEAKRVRDRTGYIQTCEMEVGRYRRWCSMGLASECRVRGPPPPFIDAIRPGVSVSRLCLTTNCGWLSWETSGPAP